MIPKADSVICVFLLATANAVHILAAGGLVTYTPSASASVSFKPATVTTFFRVEGDVKDHLLFSSL